MPIANPFSEGVSVQVDSDTSMFHSGIDRVITKLGSFHKAVGVAGGAMAALSAGAMKKSIDAFASFDESMTQSLAIMGDVDAQMRDTMSDTARQVAKDTQFSAEQAADSYFYLASAGLSAAESTEVLGDMANFAQAGQFDMARATDILTDSASALGAEVEDYNDIADVMVKTNQLANTSVEQLGEAFTNKVGGQLRNLNKDVEEGAAVLAAFADQGIKGRLAGERLNIILRDLPKAARANSDAFEEMGIQVFDAEGNMRNMGDIMADVEDATEGMSTKARIAALAQLGLNNRAADGITALMGTSDAIKTYEGELRNAGGASQEVADKQMQTLNKQVGLLRDRIHDLFIVLGEELTPSMVTSVDRLNDMVLAFGDWLEAGENAERVALGLKVVFGAGLVAAFSLVGGTLVTMAAAATAAAAPFIALGIVANELKEGWEEDFAGMRSTTEDVGAAVHDEFAVPASNAFDAVQARVDRFRDRWDESTGGMEARIEPVITAVGEDLTDAIDGSAEKIETAKDRFGPAFGFVGEVAGSAGDTVKENFVSAFETIRDVGGPVADKLFDVGEELGLISEDSDTAAEKIGDLLGHFVTPTFVNLPAKLGTLADVFDDELAWGIEQAEDAANGVLDVLREFDEGFIRPALEDITEAFDTESGNWEDAITEIDWRQHGVNLATSIGDGIETAEEGVSTKMDELVGAIESKVEDVNWLETGRDVGSTIGDGIEGAAPFVEESTDTLLDSIQTKVDERDWENTGEGIGERVGAGLVNASAFLAGAGGEIADSAETAIEERDWLGLGSDVVELMASGFTLTEDLVFGFFKGLAEGIIDELFEIDWESEGMDLLGLIGLGFVTAESGFVDDVAGVVSSASDWIDTTGQSRFDAAGESAMDGLERGMGYLFGSGPNTLFGDVTGAVWDVINWIRHDAPSAFKSAMSSAMNALGNEAASSFKSAWNSVVGRFSASIPGFSIEVPDWVPGTGGRSFSWSGASISIPALESGGLIERGGLALLHPGELVVPAADVDRSGGGGGITIHRLEVHASGRREGRDAGRAFMQEVRSGNF